MPRTAKARWLIGVGVALCVVVGAGLALLDALAVRWGVEQEAARKTVWCELYTETGTDTDIPKTPERPGRRRPSAGALGHSSARS